jgi:hypothetical protein
VALPSPIIDTDGLQFPGGYLRGKVLAQLVGKRGGR